MKVPISVVCLGGILLAGCATLPTAGPTVSQVFDQAVTDGQRHFDLVEVDNHVVATLLAQPTESFRSKFQKYGKPPRSDNRDRRYGLGVDLGGRRGVSSAHRRRPGLAAADREPKSPTRS